MTLRSSVIVQHQLHRVMRNLAGSWHFHIIISKISILSFLEEKIKKSRYIDASWENLFL